MDLIKVFEHTNSKFKLSFKDRRKGDLPFLVADNKYAKDLLKWYHHDLLNKCVRMVGIGS